LDKKDDRKYSIISIFLFAGIVAILIFVIIPKYSPLTPDRIVEKIDFSKSGWIEQYVDKSVGIFGMDFYQNTAFSYTPVSNKMVVTYASQKSVEEARNFYLALPGAQQSGRNDETSLNVTAEKDGQILQVYNYYSPISRVFELELTLDEIHAAKVISQLEKAYPMEELAKIPEIKEIVSGELFGGYVRYRYDDLDDFSYPNIPIFSRGFMYAGTEAAFNETINAMNNAYPVNKVDTTQATYYYQINGYIVSVSNFVTDSNDNIVSIGIQKMGKN
jgi:hypothetical protein